MIRKGYAKISILILTASRTGIAKVLEYIKRQF